MKKKKKKSGGLEQGEVWNLQSLIVPLIHDFSNPIMQALTE